MNGETLLALVGAAGGLISVLVTSLRKREDDTVGALRAALAREKEQRVEAEAERDASDARADGYQASLLVERRATFTLRMTLADHGITDPTA